jgi:hypothetical protein
MKSTEPFQLFDEEPLAVLQSVRRASHGALREIGVVIVHHRALPVEHFYRTYYPRN